jgi:ElaB/YqjD/DUF883 family membrane-anchored ribosome-binding protein
LLSSLELVSWLADAQYATQVSSTKEVIVEKSIKLDQLIDGAEELLTKLADVHSPEIQTLRDRVDYAIGDARRAIAQQGQEASVKLRDIVNTIDDYIRDYPWLAVATGVMVAGTVGFLAGTTIGAKKGSVRS